MEVPWLPRDFGELPADRREWLGVLRRAAKDLLPTLREDAAVESAAGMTFFLLFSIFPALLFLVALLPYLPIDTPIDKMLAAAEGSFLPEDVYLFLNDQVMAFMAQPRGSLLTGSALVSLFSASRALVSFSRALNRAYRVPKIRSEITRRLRSMGLTLFVLGAVVVFIVALSFGDNLVAGIVARDLIPVGTGVLIVIVRWPVFLVLSSVGVQQLYFLLPDRRPRWRIVSVGSVLAVLGWLLATWIFTALAGRFFALNAAYGSLGSIAVLMAWMYIGSLALIVGGTFNALVVRGVLGESGTDDHPGESE